MIPESNPSPKRPLDPLFHHLHPAAAHIIHTATIHACNDRVAPCQTVSRASTLPVHGCDSRGTRDASSGIHWWVSVGCKQFRLTPWWRSRSVFPARRIIALRNIHHPLRHSWISHPRHPPAFSTSALVAIHDSFRARHSWLPGCRVSSHHLHPRRIHFSQ